MMATASCCRTMAPIALIGWLALTVHAGGFAGGTGQPNDPFQVATAQHLVSIGSDPRLLDKCYRLVSDIDLAPTLSDGRVFTEAVIAPDVSIDHGFQGREFVGRFDGNGHTIRHLTIHGGTRSYLGLFGAVGRDAEVVNLCVADVNIVGEKDTAYVGGLVGWNEGHIAACRASGVVTGDYGVGAIAGCNADHGTILRCSATGIFRGDGRAEVVGGLVGLNDGTIAKCMVSSSEVSSPGGPDSLGGLVGLNSGSIRSCFAVTTVNGEWTLGGLVARNAGVISCSYAKAAIHSVQLSQRLGGLVGYHGGVVTNCYANGTILNAFPETSVLGGLIGSTWESAYTINSFWDSQVSSISVSEGGMGLPTSQMMDAKVYSAHGWASDPNWVLDSGNDYPRLAWEDTPGQAIPAP